MWMLGRAHHYLADLRAKQTEKAANGYKHQPT